MTVAAVCSPSSGVMAVAVLAVLGTTRRPPYLAGHRCGRRPRQPDLAGARADRGRGEGVGRRRVRRVRGAGRVGRRAAGQPGLARRHLEDVDPARGPHQRRPRRALLPAHRRRGGRPAACGARPPGGVAPAGRARRRRAGRRGRAGRPGRRRGARGPGGAGARPRAAAGLAPVPRPARGRARGRRGRGGDRGPRAGPAGPGGAVVGRRADRRGAGAAAPGPGLGRQRASSSGRRTPPSGTTSPRCSGTTPAASSCSRGRGPTAATTGTTAAPCSTRRRATSPARCWSTTGSSSTTCVVPAEDPRVEDGTARAGRRRSGRRPARRWTCAGCWSRRAGSSDVPEGEVVHDGDELTLVELSPGSSSAPVGGEAISDPGQLS